MAIQVCCGSMMYSHVWSQESAVLCTHTQSITAVGSHGTGGIIEYIKLTWLCDGGFADAMLCGGLYADH